MKQSIDRPFRYTLAISLGIVVAILVYENVTNQTSPARVDDQRAEEIATAALINDGHSDHDRLSPTTPTAYRVHSSNADSPSSNIISFATTNGSFPREPDTYQIAIDNYRDQRIQFENCVATMPIIGATFTSGATIMVEGKSYDPQIITIGQQEIVLAGFDFALITLPRVFEPQTLSIDCEHHDIRQFNAATITIYP